jgi:hypothetical protein
MEKVLSIDEYHFHPREKYLLAKLFGLSGHQIEVHDEIVFSLIVSCSSYLLTREA